MVEISVGCVNDNTYGLSCVKCGKCGRKFTMQGIDDSEVIPNKIKECSDFLKEYSDFLKSNIWDFLKSDIWKEMDINIK